MQVHDITGYMKEDDFENVNDLTGKQVYEYYCKHIKPKMQSQQKLGHNSWYNKIRYFLGLPLR